MKEIPLTQGYVAIVDDEDYERVSAYKWSSQVFNMKNGPVLVYGIRCVKVGSSWTTMRLHRFILCAAKGKFIDHIDGDGLNNTRDNLRFCTRIENARNCRHRNETSQYRGVFWAKDRAKWRSKIKISGKQIDLGHFTDEKNAALAYDAAATRLYGDFARTNFKGADQAIAAIREYLGMEAER